MTWPEASDAEDEHDARIGLHWKARALITRAAGRPFAWGDDEITDTDREWTRAYHPGPFLLHHVDPRHGLTEADYAVLGRWRTTPAARQGSDQNSRLCVADAAVELRHQSVPIGGSRSLAAATFGDGVGSLAVVAPPARLPGIPWSRSYRAAPAMNAATM